MELIVRCHNGAGVPADSTFVATIYDNSPRERGGYAYVTNAGTIMTLHASRSWIHTGAGMSITRHGTGDYTVFFPGMLTTETDDLGTALVSSVGGTEPDYCKVKNLTSVGDTIRVQVGCFRGGVPRDDSFAVQYTYKSVVAPGQLGGYLRGNQPTTPSYEPDRTFSYSIMEVLTPLSGVPRAERRAVGSYTAIYPGLPASPKKASHVTAFGNDANYCKVGLWLTDSSTSGTRAGVYCFNSAGALVDSQYMHSFMLQTRTFL
jgi:hypothetical protein